MSDYRSASKGGGKDSSGSKNKKEDVAEKVREIKLRQQNWLRQREQHISQEETPAKPRSTTAENTQRKGKATADTQLSRTQSADGRLGAKQNHIQNSNHASTKLNTRGKFQNWLKVRGDNSQSSPEIEDEDIYYNGHTSIPRDLAAEYSSIQTESSEELKARLLPPEEFDALANRIVSRAKKDLDVLQTSHERQYAQGRLTLDPDSDRADESMTSHHCSCCSVVMIGPEHIPMLLIPCGHTVCKECCQGRQLCPDCYCRIGSTTCNIMLQQIIQEYHMRHGAQRTNSGAFRKDEHYSPKNYQEKKTSKVRSPSHQTQYREQLQNLKTRLEVLASEKSSLKGERDRLVESLHRESQTLRNISKQEDNICSQIDSLEEKLSVLRQHKVEYEKKCHNLKSDHEETENRLLMLKETMSSLHKELEKVKLLSEA